jgi:hypothetical protein
MVWRQAQSPRRALYAPDTGIRRCYEVRQVFRVIVRSPEITAADEEGHTMSDKSPRVDIERMRRAYDSTRESVRQVPVLTQRAVAHIDKDMHMVGRVGRFVLDSDEPPERGGDDLAPAPLQYVVAGAAF